MRFARSRPSQTGLINIARLTPGKLLSRRFARFTLALALNFALVTFREKMTACEQERIPIFAALAPN